MSRPEFASRLEASNQELIDNLNSNRYIPPPVAVPYDNPLYQNVMGSQGQFNPGTGYNDPYGLSSIAAGANASFAYSQAMAAQAKKEALHTGISTALMAIPGVGLPLHFAYKPIAKALGWLDAEDVYSHEDYTKGSMASAMAMSTMGMMGNQFLGGNLSMAQANNLSDDIYGFMQQRGFQGLELTRMMPMLAQSGLLSPTGKFADTDEALNQFQDRLEGFLDKVTHTVRSTSVKIEEATALAVSETMLSGTRNATAGDDYFESAQYMSQITGRSLQDSDLAMRQSLGPWGSTIFDRRALASTAASNVGLASTASSSGGPWDAAWMNIDAGDFGLRMTGWGNQYWDSHRQDLARLWSSGEMPGGSAWGALAAGEGMPDSVDSYKSIGDFNDRLEAQYYGMQMAAEHPDQMTSAAIGLFIDKMTDKGAISREAQIAYMMSSQGGNWDMDEAAAMLDFYDQGSTQRGRMESYIDRQRDMMGIEAGAIRRDLQTTIAVSRQLSAEQNAERGSLITSELGHTMMMSGGEGVISGIAGWQEEFRRDGRWNFDADTWIRTDEDPEHWNMNQLLAGGRSSLARHGFDPGLVNQWMFDISDLEDDELMALVNGLEVNRGRGRSSTIDIDVGDKLKAAAIRYGYEQHVPGEAYMSLEDSIRGYVDSIGGMENFKIWDEISQEYVSLGDVTSGTAGDYLSLYEQGPGRAVMLGMYSGGAGEWLQSGMYEVYSASPGVQRLMEGRMSAGETHAKVLATAAEQGYFSGMGTPNTDDISGFLAGAETMNEIMYLGNVTEEMRGFQHQRGPAGDEYRALGHRLANQGFNFDAIATDGATPMTVRDDIARLGFEGVSSYGELNAMQREYVDEIIHANDPGGQYANPAGHYLDVGAWETMSEQLEGITFGFSDQQQAGLAALADEFGTTQSDVQAWSRWKLAERSGEFTQDELDELKGDISNFAGASEAGGEYVRRYAGGSWEQGLGNLMYADAISPIMEAAGNAGMSGQQIQDAVSYYVETGSLKGLSVEGLDMDTAIGKFISTGDAEDFFNQFNMEVPTGGAPDFGNIPPQFQDAPVMLVANSGGPLEVTVTNTDDFAVPGPGTGPSGDSDSGALVDTTWSALGVTLNVN